jgi:hypothetical protein
MGEYRMWNVADNCWENVYTADDEEPKCGRCDNMCIPYDSCVQKCGAEHGWNLYKRTVKE